MAKELDADDDEYEVNNQDQDKSVDSESESEHFDGEILTESAMMTVANRGYMSHEQELLMTKAK